MENIIAPGGFLPPWMKPLNCSGTSDEEIGRQMSNLHPAEFHFRGVKFASVEGFYIGLYTDDPELRLEAASLHGRQAKNRGRKFKQKFQLSDTTFDGKVIMLGSPEHHALIKEVIREKLLQNPEILRAFVATRPRPLIHDTGFPESRFTNLPGEKFCQILAELRDELAEGQAEF